MDSSLVDPSLAFAAELEQRDAALAAQLAALDRLERQTDELRGRASGLQALVERLPQDRIRVDATLVEAARELEAARVSLQDAERSLERAGSDDARVTAERRHAHAATDYRITEERAERLRERREAIDAETAGAESEGVALAVRAAELAQELAAAPRASQTDPPGAGLPELVEWAGRAHAALFVARSGVATEQERVIREANELAAAVLGEPLYATSVATVRLRLAERLG